MTLGPAIKPKPPDPPPEWVPDPDDKKFEISTANPLFKRTKLPLPPVAPPPPPVLPAEDFDPGIPPQGD